MKYLGHNFIQHTLSIYDNPYLICGDDSYLICETCKVLCLGPMMNGILRISSYWNNIGICPELTLTCNEMLIKNLLE
jgi:hypothetical protein